MTQKFKYYTIFAILATWTIATLIALIIMIYPYQLFDIRIPAHTDRPQYTHGESIQYQGSVCKLMEAQGVVTRFLRNVNTGVVTRMNAVKTTLSPGCIEYVVDTQYIIPETVLPGKYVVDIHYTYDINFLRSVSGMQETNIFEISAK